jgi:hypothetical protein
MASIDPELTRDDLERLRAEERAAVTRAQAALTRTESILLVSRLAREETRCIVERTRDSIEEVQVHPRKS